MVEKHISYSNLNKTITDINKKNWLEVINLGLKIIYIKTCERIGEIIRFIFLLLLLNFA